MERTKKLCTLRQAAGLVKNGDRVAFGGFAVYQKPMALVQELVRLGRRELTVVGAVNSLDVDMLVGAGCVSTVETSYVGLEKYGLAPNYRRAVQEGRVKVIHYPEMLAWDRFRADREGLPYWPVYFLGGNDVALRNPDIVPYNCPVTGKAAWAVPAAKPDVVMIHAWRGDAYGNIQIQPRHLLPQSQDVDMARACGKVIVTVEELVSTEEIKKAPHLTLIPGFRTTAVVHVPHGSHPTATLLSTKEDAVHFAQYVEAAKTPEGFDAYLKQYIAETETFEGYLARVGKKQVEELVEVC